MVPFLLVVTGIVCLLALHHPQHRIVIRKLVALHQRFPVSPPACGSHIRERKVFALSCPHAPVPMPEPAIQLLETGCFLRLDKETIEEPSLQRMIRPLAGEQPPREGSMYAIDEDRLAARDVPEEETAAPHSSQAPPPSAILDAASTVGPINHRSLDGPDSVPRAR